MANQKKTWFLVPGWDIPPSAVQLGSLIADPTAPQRALLSAASAAAVAAETATQDPITTNNTSPPPILHIHAKDIHTTPPKKNFKMVLSDNHTNTYGLWARFLHIFGLGAEGEVRFSKAIADSYAFEVMQTSFFVPTPTFAETAISTERVKNFLKAAGKHTPLYIITGLKTVQGATVSTTRGKGRGFGGKVSLDLTSVGALMTMGPGAEHESEEKVEVKWTCEGPITFAYQLERVKIGSKGAVLKEFVEGAMFDADDREMEERVAVELGGEEEGEHTDVDIVSAFDEEDGEECLVGVPKLDTDSD